MGDALREQGNDPSLLELTLHADGLMQSEDVMGDGLREQGKKPSQLELTLNADGFTQSEDAMGDALREQGKAAVAVGGSKGSCSGGLDVTAAVAVRVGCEVCGVADRVADEGRICVEREAAEALDKVLGAIWLQAYGLADLPAKFRRKQRVILRNQVQTVGAFVRQVGSAVLSATLAEIELCLCA